MWKKNPQQLRDQIKESLLQRLTSETSYVYCLVNVPLGPFADLLLPS